MSDQIKTFSLVVITICVFIITVIDILNMVETKKHRVTSQPQVTTITPPQSPKVNPPAEPVADEPQTKMVFEEMKFDFGDLDEGDEVKHKFAFTNAGANPLIISEAHGSCGCTIPSYSKEPIPPGKSGEIEVQFNSKGKNGLQNKTVTVTANTDPPQTILHISANVIKGK